MQRGAAARKASHASPAISSLPPISSSAIGAASLTSGFANTARIFATSFERSWRMTSSSGSVAFAPGAEAGVAARLRWRRRICSGITSPGWL